MAARSYPPDILDQATDIMAACQQIDPNLKVGAMTQDDFADVVSQAQSTQARITALELQLTDLRNKRDDQLTTIWDTVKRVRATVRGIYGDDSSAYEMVGCTRLSDRKKAGRKPSA